MRVRDERLAWAEAKLCECRRIALRYFGSPLRVERKPDRSPVTVADRTLEERLHRQIARAFPGEAIVGEEEGLPPQLGPSYWTIDPIDGTRAFSRGLPSWGILLGRIRGRREHLDAALEILDGARNLEGCPNRVNLLAARTRLERARLDVHLQPARLLGLVGLYRAGLPHEVRPADPGRQGDARAARSEPEIGFRDSAIAPNDGDRAGHLSAGISSRNRGSTCAIRRKSVSVVSNGQRLAIADAAMKQSTCRYFQRDKEPPFRWKSTRRDAMNSGGGDREPNDSASAATDTAWGSWA